MISFPPGAMISEGGCGPRMGVVSWWVWFWQLSRKREVKCFDGLRVLEWGGLSWSGNEAGTTWERVRLEERVFSSAVLCCALYCNSAILILIS